MLRHLWSRTAAAASASVRIRSAAPTVCGGIASSAAHKLWIARALSTSGAAATTRTVSTALRTTTSASKSIQPVGLPSNWLVPALSTSPFALQQQRRWASADAAATAASAGGNGKQRTNTGGDGGSGSGSGSGGSGQQNSGEDEQKSSRMWDRFLWLRVLWNTYSPNSKQALVCPSLLCYQFVWSVLCVIGCSDISCLCCVCVAYTAVYRFLFVDGGCT